MRYIQKVLRTILSETPVCLTKEWCKENLNVNDTEKGAVVVWERKAVAGNRTVAPVVIAEICGQLAISKVRGAIGTA